MRKRGKPSITGSMRFTSSAEFNRLNISRLPTGLLLAEDAIPYALGTRPRYVLDGVERGGVRELSYPLRSDLRGKFTIGPLEVRIADACQDIRRWRKKAGRPPFGEVAKTVRTPPRINIVQPARAGYPIPCARQSIPQQRPSIKRPPRLA